MKILLITAAADWSTIDQSTGYEAAFRSLGHDIKPFRLNRRIEFWHTALNHWNDLQNQGRPVSEQNPPVPIEAVLQDASAWALIEAAKFQPDFILITSGMGFHPDALVMLRNHGYKVALALSESPYDDVRHAHLAPLVDYVFTNESQSVDLLREYNPNTVYLPTAYSSAVHHPGLEMPADSDPTPPDVDVLFVGTGFKERERFLEAALTDPAWPAHATFQCFGFFGWSNNDMSLGVEPGWGASPLAPYTHNPISNDEVAARYQRAKIVLNFYRDGAGYSMNPRAYEIGACGAFQLAQDVVGEAHDIYGDTIAYFTTPHELAERVAHWLLPRNAAIRLFMAQRAHERVRGQDYTARASLLIDTMAEVLPDPADDTTPTYLSLSDAAALQIGKSVSSS